MTPAEHPDAVVQITLRDVWEGQQAHGVILAKIEATLERLVDAGTAQDAKLADHETRIRALERRVWQAVGAAAIAAASGSALLSRLIGG